MVDEDFREIAKRAEAAYRAEVAAAYGDELAGRDTGRMSRHLPGEASPEANRKRRREGDQRFLSALETLLQDPAYRARYEAFGVFLTITEAKADDLLELTQSQLESFNSQISDATGAAPKLNGKAIFRRADGRVIDEDGNTVPAAEVDGVTCPPKLPSL